jgi:hypothetical protein
MMSVMSMMTVSMLFMSTKLMKGALMRELVLSNCSSLLDISMMTHVHLSVSLMRSNWNFVVIFFVEWVEY